MPYFRQRHPIRLPCILVLLGLPFFLGCSPEKAGGPEESDPVPNQLGPEGGTLTYGNGMSLVVPAGALSAQETLVIEKLDSASADSMVCGTGLAQKRLLAAFSASPSGLHFLKPVTVVVPVGPLSPAGVPVHYRIDFARRAASVEPTDLVLDPDAGELRLSLTSFSGHAVAEVEGALQDNVCREADACRCGAIHVQETTDETVSQNGDCQVVQVSGFVEFLDCPGSPRESWTFYEASPECMPVMEITAPASLNQGDASPVSLSVSFGGQAIEARTASFSVTGPGAVSPATGATSNGRFETVFTAGDRAGTAVLRAEAVVEYVHRVIILSTGETEESPTRTARLVKTASIAVKADSLAYVLSLSCERSSMDNTDSQNVTAFLRDRDGNPVNGQRVYFSAMSDSDAFLDLSSADPYTSNGRAVAVFHPGYFEGIAHLYAYADLEIPERDTTLTITAAADVRVNAVEEDWSGSLVVTDVSCDICRPHYNATLTIQFSFTYRSVRPFVFDLAVSSTQSGTVTMDADPDGISEYVFTVNDFPSNPEFPNKRVSYSPTRNSLEMSFSYNYDGTDYLFKYSYDAYQSGEYVHTVSRTSKLIFFPWGTAPEVPLEAGSRSVLISPYVDAGGGSTAVLTLQK